MKTKKYTRLTYKERVRIEAYLILGKSLSEISVLLKRDRSTVWREVTKWVRVPGDRYRADLAHWYSVDWNGLKRRDYSKIGSNSLLRYYIYKGLLRGWTAEQISRRVARDYRYRRDMRISHESIYVYIYTKTGGELRKRLISLLPCKKVNRRRSSYQVQRRVKIRDRVGIRYRPKEVKRRKVIGHWEGDLIIGQGQRSALGTLVERKTRYLKIVRVNSRKSKEVSIKLAKSLIGMPDEIRKTLTYDNGVEMACHKDFTRLTGMPVYFADPYCSWQRGTNENTNGLIRRYFPKKTDFNQVSEERIREVELLLNTRPRKVLGWLTPMEALLKEAV